MFYICFASPEAPQEGGATVPEALPVPRVRTVPAILGGPADVDPLIGSGNPKGPLKDVRISICIYIYSIYIYSMYIHMIYIYTVYIHTYVYI